MYNIAPFYIFLIFFWFNQSTNVCSRN